MGKTKGAVDLVSLFILLVSLVVSVIVAEAFMRWHMFGSDGLSYKMMKSVRHIGRSGLVRASQYQDILWELKPNLDELYKLKRFQTTSDGLRDLEYSREKPEGTYRVAVIGDSYTMGEGVAYEDLYHVVLEERLNKESKGKKFEFINFGVAGYSLPQYRSTINRKVRLYSPDLIFIGFCAANDSKKPNLEAFNQPFKEKTLFNGFFNVFFFEHIGDVYKRVYKYLRNRYPGYNADEEYVKGEFSRLKELSEELHIPILVAYLDNRSPSADFDMVKSVSLANGFSFINGTDGFGTELDEGHIIYKTDTHPNGVANRIMASSIYKEIKAGRAGPLSKAVDPDLID